MSYTVQQLATLAGISVRTLHYYDQIGLLEPAVIKSNGYRYYEEKELLRLQQILFFRELDFPLEYIKQIIFSENFDMREALRDQRKLIELKKSRLNKLIGTIDKTIKKINKEKNMEDKELYAGLSKEDAKKYAEEAKQRWGNTEAYKESQKRVKKMTKNDWAKLEKGTDELMENLVASMSQKPDSKEVQTLIARHYNNLRTFYEPNLEMYKGLAEMYLSDPRFTAYFEKYAKGFAQFMHDAMIAYCKAQK